jgi:hypothetical protein
LWPSASRSLNFASSALHDYKQTSRQADKQARRAVGTAAAGKDGIPVRASAASRAHAHALPVSAARRPPHNAAAARAVALGGGGHATAAGVVHCDAQARHRAGTGPACPVNAHIARQMQGAHLGGQLSRELHAHRHAAAVADQGVLALVPPTHSGTLKRRQRPGLAEPCAHAVGPHPRQEVAAVPGTAALRGIGPRGCRGGWASSNGPRGCRGGWGSNNGATRCPGWAGAGTHAGDSGRAYTHRLLNQCFHVLLAGLGGRRRRQQ